MKIETRSIPGGKYLVGPDKYTKRIIGRVPTVRDRLVNLEAQEVTIAPFEISVFPITNKQYETFDPQHVRGHNGELDDHPVVDITFFEVQKFCTQYGYRLPTAIEWEVAARGPSNLPLSNGTSIDRRMNNFFPSKGPSIKGEYPPNGFGLYDFAGNVSEYTSSCIDISEGQFVVLVKGGNWGACKYSAFTSYFYFHDPILRSSRIGFRVCKDVQ